MRISTVGPLAMLLAGLAAGAVRMPMRRFFLSVLAGKIIKDTWMAAVGAGGVAVFAHLI